MIVVCETATPDFPTFLSKIVISAIRAKSPSFFPIAVRNLMLLHDDSYDAATILGVCTGVENLAISYGQEAWIPLIASLPLKHLYASCSSLLRTLRPTHPVFSRLTHLELEDSLADPDGSGGLVLASLPRLTHLSFSYSGLIPLCPKLLGSCRALRVLACLNQYALLLNEAYAVSLMCDVRFVIMRIANYVKDWHIGAEGGADYWSRAEDFIERRRTGEINCTCAKLSSQMVDPIRWQRCNT
jgi:hypothetical protein